MLCSVCGKPLGILRSILGARDHPECVDAHNEQLKREEAARNEREREEAEARQIKERQEKAEAEAREIKERQEKAAHHQVMMDQIARGEFKALNEYSEMMLGEDEKLCVLLKGCWSTFFYPRAAGRILPGQAVRVDGLKKVDFGSLHITDRRVCFVGKGGAKILPLKKLLQCEGRGDALHLTVEGTTSSSYFIIDSPEALDIARAAILKLAQMGRQKSATRKGRRKAVYIWRCTMDENSCQRCRDRHRTEWEKKNEVNPPPYSGCQNDEGCRCELVKVYDDEPYPGWAYPD